MPQVTIPKSDSRIIPLAFVIRAIDKKEKAPFCHLLVEEGLAIGTDKIRLHYAYVKDIDNGLYSFEVSNEQKKLILTYVDGAIHFPDWRSLLPDTLKMNRCRYTATFENSRQRTIDIYRFWKESGLCVGFDYLKDLHVKNVSYQSFWKDEHSPVLFAGSHGAGLGALISPILDAV